MEYCHHNITATVTMRLFIICAIALSLCAVITATPRPKQAKAHAKKTPLDLIHVEGERCNQPRFRCGFKDPCIGGLCVEGQIYYSGPTANQYVKCSGENNEYCTQYRCSRKTYWNQAHERCENADGVESRCSYGRFDCEDRNPCAPSLCQDGVTSYPGDSPNRFVTCGDCNSCTPRRCERLHVFDPELQECVLKSQSDESESDSSDDDPWWWPSPSSEEDDAPGWWPDSQEFDWPDSEEFDWPDSQEFDWPWTAQNPEKSRNNVRNH